MIIAIAFLALAAAGFTAAIIALPSDGFRRIPTDRLRLP